MTRRRQNADAPWIIAHRGAMREAPENTRSAFEAALAHPIDGIELDVQMTKDGVLVLYHDDDLLKITGRREPVGSFSYAQLGRLDWGGWHADGFRGEKLLTLEEALDLFGRRTRLMVEIKSLAGDRRSGRSLELASRVMETLDRKIPRQHAGRIFVLSFDPAVLRHAVRMDGPWRYVLNSENPAAAAAGALEEHLYGYCISIARLDERTVEYSHSVGKKVLTYSCNEPREVSKAIDLGCDVIMTDRPGWIFGYLASRRPRP